MIALIAGSTLPLYDNIINLIARFSIKNNIVVKIVCVVVNQQLAWWWNDKASPSTLNTTVQSKECDVFAHNSEVSPAVFTTNDVQHSHIISTTNITGGGVISAAQMLWMNSSRNGVGGVCSFQFLSGRYLVYRSIYSYKVIFFICWCQSHPF